VAYDYINVEEDEQASNWVKEQNDGKERKPTLKVGKQVLSVPSEEELRLILTDNGML
jgi:mycoredoxin